MDKGSRGRGLGGFPEAHCKKTKTKNGTRGAEAGDPEGIQRHTAKTTTKNKKQKNGSRGAEAGDSEGFRRHTAKNNNKRDKGSRGRGLGGFPEAHC